LSETASHRTRDELEAAIRNLSAADWGRLGRIAAYYARGRPIEDQDLLRETFRRALDGGRKWPTGLDVVPFLAGTMRSISVLSGSFLRLGWTVLKAGPGPCGSRPWYISVRSGLSHGGRGPAARDGGRTMTGGRWLSDH